MTESKLIDFHLAKFKTKPKLIALAPGRVNFIGEHTDYNGGLVMPLALNMGVYSAVSENNKGLLRIQSLDFNKYEEFEISSLQPDNISTWANCPKGIIKMLINAGCSVKGVDLTMTGDIPIGAGLSSSAAAEVSAGFAVKELFSFTIDGIKLALLAQKSEHEFLGTKCGIMDQAISILGKKDTLFKLSCNDLSFDYIPFRMTDMKLLIINSGVKHNLAAGEYNIRRAQCDEAFKIAKNVNPGIETLSDFSLELLDKNRNLFSDILYQRCHHVLSENLRLLEVARCLALDDFVSVGRLLTESHRSLQKDYEVSCPELDFLVDLSLKQAGVLGARMTGGGFGGCIIVLIQEKGEGIFKKSLSAYKREYDINPVVFEAVSSDGAKIIYRD